MPIRMPRTTELRYVADLHNVVSLREISAT